jgi:uncharacterized protein YigE (DUF2233 family)
MKTAHRPIECLCRQLSAVVLSLLVIASASAAEIPWRLLDSASLSSGPPAITQKLIAEGKRQVRVHVATFSNETHTLRVIDNADGRATLPSALSAAGCVAGVNGGYFYPDQTPLGLVVAGGKEIHPYKRARLLSGLLVVDHGNVRLLRVREYSPKTKPDEALQAGPLLVDRSQSVKGLNAKNRAERTVVATDGKGEIALVVMGSVTLSEAAMMLADASLFPEIRIARALNLDGGASTGFWAASAGVDIRPWRPVRNYVGIAPK